MKIGFIGLGVMGVPMAKHLVKAGYEVAIWGRNPHALDALVELGAMRKESAANVAAEVDVLISMLADDEVVRTVLQESGALACLKPDAIHVNMATVSVDFAREMAAYHQSLGLHYIAAPVLGRVNVAEAGQLNIVAAGSPSALERVQPLFDIMGQKTWYYGEAPEQANVIKLAVNFMIGSAIEAMGEASALVKGHGMPVDNFMNMITSTLFSVPVYQGYGSAIAKDHYEPGGFKLSLGFKDILLGLKAAEQVRVPMPFASALRDNLLDSVAHDEGHLDFAALARVSSRRAGQS